MEMLPNKTIHKKEDAMKNITDLRQKVKGQKLLMALERASWILGIDVGKEKLSCALLLKEFRR